MSLVLIEPETSSVLRGVIVPMPRFPALLRNINDASAELLHSYPSYEPKYVLRFGEK